MSLILCRMEPVKHPFEVTELGVRLYSSQELCYVIYENPLMVMDDFVDDRLIRFIEEDLDMSFLAGKLENWRKSGENPDNLLLLILNECSYYRTAEINAFRQKLIDLRKLHPARLTKEKADDLFLKKQYGRAIVLYEKLLEEERDETVNDRFVSRVWMCLGACQARLFQSEKACHAYDRAFFYDAKNEDILERIFDLKTMFPELVLSDRITSLLEHSEKKELWAEKFQNAMEKGKEADAVKKLDELFSRDSVKRLAGATALVQTWKQEYRGMI